jgi:hypothetical protein
MDKFTRNFIIGIFMLHIISVVAVILAFYVLNIDPRALRILIYYLASFLTVYFVSVLCYFLIGPDQNIAQPNPAFSI